MFSCSGRSSWRNALESRKSAGKCSAVFPQTTFPRLIILAAACLTTAAACAQTQLRFTDAYPVSEPVVMTPTSLAATGFATATAEEGEPAHDGSPARNSLWARFIAKESGLFRLSRSSESTATMRVGVYTNDALATLGRVASVTLMGETNELRWEAVAGVTYSVAFDSTNRTPTIPTIAMAKFFVRAQPDRPLKIGEIVTLEAVSTDPGVPLDGVVFSQRSAVFGSNPFGPWTSLPAVDSAPWQARVTNIAGGLLEIRATTPTATSLSTPVYLRPPNDDVAEAAELPGAFSALIEQRSLGIGSVEPGEFLPRRNEWFGTPATIWWKWTPTFSVNFSVTSQSHGLWAAYDGNPFTTAPLGSGFNALQFPAEAGRTYFLQMVVAGSPRFATNRIEFRQEVLALTLPPGSLRDDSIRTATGTGPAFVLPSGVVELGTASLLPDETFSGFRLNGLEPTRFEAGLPIFQLEVAPEGKTYQLSATNAAGIRVTAPALFLATRPANDAVALASELQESSGVVNGSLGTATADEPGAVNSPGAKTRWWRFSVPGDSSVDLDLRADGSIPLAARLAVFRGLPEPATEPLALVQGTAKILSLSFEAATAGTFFVSADMAGSYALNLQAIHPFRWINLPRTVEAGLDERLELSASWEAGLVINRIEFEGRSESYGGSPPLSYSLYPNRAGAQPLRVHYTRGDGTTRVLERLLAVKPRGDTFGQAENNQVRDNAGSGELTLASLQDGEPEPVGGSAGSVWHAWSPNRPGDFRLTRTAGQQAQIAVFEGDQLSSLRLIETLGVGEDSAVFSVGPERPYRIRVSSASASTESYQFSLTWIPQAPTLSVTLAPTAGGEFAAQLSFTTVPLEPYSIWSAEMPDGPWKLEESINAGETITVFSVQPNASANLFFRVTSP